jgi:hypothetical protein
LLFDDDAFGGGSGQRSAQRASNLGRGIKASGYTER